MLVLKTFSVFQPILCGLTFQTLSDAWTVIVGTL